MNGPQQFYRYQRRVVYSDCTVGNHVYYSRYLDFLEEARGEFFRNLGIPFLKLQEQGILFPVIEARLTYKAPARYDDVIVIDVAIKELKRLKLAFTYSIWREKTLLLEAETLHVSMNLEEKPSRMPESLASILQSAVLPSPDQPAIISLEPL
ncbi:MAG: thioesterase family protein [Verrucomicrobiota bacterium]|nr:thioesterase family protein [Verrucomicrobiota bacterium]